MGHIDSETFEAFMAFGEASMAFSAEVTGSVNRSELAGDSTASVPSDLLLELRSAHARLRDLFAEGHDDAVCALAPLVI
jgi:hypothetical protein